MGRDISSSFLLRWVAVVLLGCGVANAMAEGDPPGRVARLNYSEGKAAYAPAGDDEWTDADFNRPLVRGDKLWTDKGVRAELQAGSSVVRMDGRTQLTVLALDDQSAQLSVTQGTVYVRVRNLPEGENFEIDTPNLAYRAAYPGDYRIDVDAQRGVTRVTIHSGTGAVYGEKGEALPLGGGQQITFKGRALEKVNVQEQPPQDNFDRWAAERNRREDQSVAARYVPRDLVGYQALDATGEWRNESAYGPVWYPQGMPATWAPYRNGRWEWIAPWGWTWIDEAPWAFVTSHYGRWTVVGTRWAWVPGRPGLHPIYAPALVAFVGNGNSPLAIGGKQTVAWFPLAPGEAWQPPYKATPLYISSVNANMPPLKEGAYAFQRRPEALTAISIDDFHRGKPAKGSWLRVAANALGNAQVIAPPAMPEQRSRTMLARSQPPATTPEIKQVTNSGPTVQQQIEAQRQAQMQAQLQAQRETEAQKQRAAQLEQQRLQQEQQARAEQTRREEQQKIAEQRRIAEQLKQAELARRADQQRTADEQRRIAEQTRRVEQQKVAEQQRRAAEQQRMAQQQQRAEEQRAALQKAEQARAQARLEARAEAARMAQAQRGAEQKRAAAEARRAAVEAKREREREAVASAKRAKQEREQQAKRTLEAKRLAAAAAKKDEQARRAAHAQQVEQARRAADRDAQVLAQQRAEREAAAARKVAEDKERAQRDAWQKQQQALAEQFKRDQQAWEEQQRAKAQRQRPDLRRTTPGEPEVWQRGIPVLSPGRTS
jgi:hypothetical protein